MAEIRKLGRTTDHRLAMLKNLATSVIWHGQIERTVAKAKEVKSIVDSLTSLAIKEKDNFEMVEKTTKRAKVDEKTGLKITEKATSKNGKEFYNCTKGIIITNNFFTSQAIQQANSLNEIYLWDRNVLIQMINDMKTKNLII